MAFHDGRRRWMAVLANSELEPLEALLAAAPALPNHVLLRGPEVGLVMVQGRAAGTVFNLGEMTATRCTVRNADASVGHAYLAGRHLRRAELAAALDAALQDAETFEAIDRAIITPLARLQAQARADQALRAKETRVDFATLATMRA